MPRFSISSLMILVVLVAVEVWACKTLLEPPLVGGRDMYNLILFGMVPMANVLLLGSMPFWTRAGRARERPILLGFEAFGVAAMLLFFAACLVAGHEIQDWVSHSLRFLQPVLPIFLMMVVVILILPQLALASLGAWLSTEFKVRVMFQVQVEHRTPANPEETDPTTRVRGLEAG